MKQINFSQSIYDYKNDYLGDHQTIFLPYSVLNFIGTVLGTVGNLIVLFTIVCDKKLKENPAYILMFNLAFSDLAISVVVHSFTNIGKDKYITLNFLFLNTDNHPTGHALILLCVLNPFFNETILKISHENMLVIPCFTQLNSLDSLTK